jgi:hypothetical protein
MAAMAPPYPRTYRVHAATRRTIDFVVLLVMGIAVAGVGLSLAGVIHNPNSSASLIGIAGAFVVGGVAMIASNERRRATFYEDRVESVLWFSPRCMRNDQIAGRRMGVQRSRIGVTYYYILIGKDGAELRLPPYLAYDKAFHDWMNAIPQRGKG